jgi:hypothetical protein
VISARSCTVFDHVGFDDLTTERSFTPEGFLMAPAKVARTGIQLYYARELGLDEEGIPGDKVIRLYRPIEEVSNPESIASGENKPITIGHPKDGVTCDNWRDLAVGEARDLQYVPDNAPAGGFIKARLLIKDAAAIKAVQSGKNQLSCGYTFDLDRTSGTSPTGEPFDGVMRRIRFNHHAIVDLARGGSGLRIADATPEGKETMATRKITVDGFTLDLPENDAVAVEKLATERTQLRTAIDELSKKVSAADEALQASVKELAKAKADHAVELKTAKDQIPTEAKIAELAAARAKVISAASKLCPEMVCDGKSVDEIRRAVVADVAGKNAGAKTIADAITGGDIAKADIAMVTAAFNALSASISTADAARTAGDDAVSAALLSDDEAKQKNDKATTAQPQMCARDAWIAKSQAK